MSFKPDIILEEGIIMYTPLSKRLATLLVLVCGTCGTLAHGGMKLTVGQNGLNEVMTYYLEDKLVPYLHDDLNIADQTIEFGTSRIHINKVAFEKLEHQTATVEISSGDTLTLAAGFSKLSLSANITVFGNEVIRANDTVVHFSECSLNVTFALGTGGNAADVVLKSCNATIGGFAAEGQLDRVLEGAFLLGQDYISSLLEDVCPQLENITNESLKDILNVQDTVTISSSTVGDISINAKLLSVTTERGYITVAVEVALGTDPYVDDVTFPIYNFNMADTDVVLLVNDPLLSKIILLAIQTTVLDSYLFNTIVHQNTYKVQVNENSIQASVRSSEYGTSVFWNATFDVQRQHASHDCKPFIIQMESVIPFVISHNDTWVVASVDNERLQMAYTVSAWNAACIGSSIPIEELIDVQKTILNETNSLMETQLRDKSFSMKLPTDKWYGFEDAHINTLNGGLELAFGLRVGREHNVPTTVLIIEHNKHYQGKLITYTLSNGQQVQIDMSTTTSPVPDAASLAVPGSNLILFLAILMWFL